MDPACRLRGSGVAVTEFGDSDENDEEEETGGRGGATVLVVWRGNG